MRIEHKIVPIYAVPEAGTRCHVFILDEYLRKLPKPLAFEKDNFYLQPIAGAEIKSPEGPWFTTIPVGRNTLQKMVQGMCAECGLSGYKTNHSLRATGATELFTAGVPEKVIQKHTGHLSLSGLRHYERVTEEQEMSVSRVLSASAAANMTFQENREEEKRVVRKSCEESNLKEKTTVEEKPPGVGENFPEVYEKPDVKAVADPHMNFIGCTVNIYQDSMP